MKAKLFQMKLSPTAENFHLKVATAQPEVSFDVMALDTEGVTARFCVVELPNQGPQGRFFCRAYLADEHIDGLIAALNAYKALP